ncbi:MAG: SAM-dependent methyltransferase [Spirochaetes bacterium]|nr:SAM-dependent methyltransferase [Spirochaetota bacterium]
MTHSQSKQSLPPPGPAAADTADTAAISESTAAELQPVARPAYGSLYLIPVPISPSLPQQELAPIVLQTIMPIRDFIVENQRTALRFLSRILDSQAMADTQLQELSEHTNPADIPALLAPMLAGRDAAIISEAGSPCIADPGALLVLAAHRKGISVHPLPGPVSMMLALMASGFGGQNFSFQGYLPVDSAQRRQALKDLERQSARNGSTIIFIETPYRNSVLIDTAIDCLQASTLFCVAAGLLSQEERVLSTSIRSWQQESWRPGKIPAVFLLLAAGGSNADRPQNHSPRQSPTAAPANSKKPQPRTGSARQKKRR